MATGAAKPNISDHVTYAHGTSAEACGIVRACVDSLKQDGFWGGLVEWHQGRRETFEAIGEADFLVGLVTVTQTCGK